MSTARTYVFLRAYGRHGEGRRVVGGQLGERAVRLVEPVRLLRDALAHLVDVGRLKVNVALVLRQATPLETHLMVLRPSYISH